MTPPAAAKKTKKVGKNIPEKRETDRPLTKKGFDKKSSGFPPQKLEKFEKSYFIKYMAMQNFWI